MRRTPSTSRSISPPAIRSSISARSSSSTWGNEGSVEMSGAAAVSTIAHQIQLAVAPVFLLAGIGLILNVLAGRLARVVERARQLERDFTSFDDETRAAAMAELQILDMRMTVVNLALSAC